MLKSGKRFAILYACLICILMACTNGTDTNISNSSTRDSSGVVVIEYEQDLPVLWHIDSVPLLEIGHKSSPSVEFLRIVSAFVLEDQRIVVAEGSPPRLQVFDSNGNLITTAGGSGGGPGEFQSIAWIRRLNSDTLIVMNSRTSRVSTFNDSLTYSGSLELQQPDSELGGMPTLVGVFADRTLLASSRLMMASGSGSGMIRPNQVLYRHNELGADPESLFTTYGDETVVMQGIIARPPFAKQTRIVTGDDEIYVTTSNRVEVSIYDTSGKLKRVIRQKGAALPVSKSDLERFQLTETEVLYPAVSSMLLDDSGNIWLEKYRTNSDSTAMWTVFSSTGDIAGSAIFGAGFRPLHIYKERVLGVQRDSLDVERIIVGKLSKKEW